MDTVGDSAESSIPSAITGRLDGKSARGWRASTLEENSCVKSPERVDSGGFHDGPGHEFGRGCSRFRKRPPHSPGGFYEAPAPPAARAPARAAPFGVRRVTRRSVPVARVGGRPALDGLDQGAE